MQPSFRAFLCVQLANLWKSLKKCKKREKKVSLDTVTQERLVVKSWSKVLAQETLGFHCIWNILSTISTFLDERRSKGNHQYSYAKLMGPAAFYVIHNQSEIVLIAFACRGVSTVTEEVFIKIHFPSLAYRCWCCHLSVFEKAPAKLYCVMIANNFGFWAGA